MKASKIFCALALLASSQLFSSNLSNTALADTVAYSDSAFQSALASGKPAMLDFHASWCPTCLTQSKRLVSVMKDPALSALTIFTADFDNSADLQKTYRATTQGTLILFRGGKEIDRSVGVTDEAALKTFLLKAVQ